MFAAALALSIGRVELDVFAVGGDVLHRASVIQGAAPGHKTFGYVDPGAASAKTSSSRSSSLCSVIIAGVHHANHASHWSATSRETLAVSMHRVAKVNSRWYVPSCKASFLTARASLIPRLDNLGTT